MFSSCNAVVHITNSFSLFAAHDNCFLHEFDQRKIARYFVSPSCRVPTLQESTGRAIADFGVSWKKGLIPNHLEGEFTVNQLMSVSCVLDIFDK